MVSERETHNQTVTVGGEDRDLTWKQGVGIYVAGHDFGYGATVKVKGTRTRWSRYGG